MSSCSPPPRLCGTSCTGCLAQGLPPPLPLAATQRRHCCCSPPRHCTAAGCRSWAAAAAPVHYSAAVHAPVLPRCNHQVIAPPACRGSGGLLPEFLFKLSGGTGAVLVKLLAARGFTWPPNWAGQADAYCLRLAACPSSPIAAPRTPPRRPHEQGKGPQAPDHTVSGGPATPTHRAAMNIFRLAGDMTHLLSIMVLLLKIRATKSCRGERPPFCSLPACPSVSRPHPRVSRHL